MTHRTVSAALAALLALALAAPAPSVAQSPDPGVYGTYSTYFPETGRTTYIKLTPNHLGVLGIDRRGTCLSFPSTIRWEGNTIKHYGGMEWEVSPVEGTSEIIIRFPATEEHPPKEVLYTPEHEIPFSSCTKKRAV